MSVALAILDGVREDDYHADRVGFDTPSLSASAAHTLCSKSVAHAAAQHPRLNPDWVEEPKDHYDVGTAVHDALLLGVDRIHRIEVDSFRTDAAKLERDTARANGMIPLKAADHDEVIKIIDAVREQLPEINAAPMLLSDGRPEQTLVWTEPNGVNCRARLDWLRDDRVAIDDLKTSHNANPDVFARSSFFDNGYDIKAAFYLRGLAVIEPNNFQARQFRFIVVDKNPPYPVVVYSPAPDTMELAHRKVEYAIQTWGKALETTVFPGYPREVCWVNLTPWAESKWFDREAREEVAA